MALNKTENEIKWKKRQAKRDKIDNLSNLFMINLVWGVVGFIALGIVGRLYSDFKTILVAPMILKITAAVLFAVAIVLFVLGKMGVFKNKKRAINYSIFAAATALISLYLGFYAQVRNILIKVFPALSSIRSEWWYLWGPRYLIGIYLVALFIVITIKILILNKKK